MLEIIKKYSINAKKSFWQNFLLDEKVLNEIASISNIDWENILEIWPWFWALTNILISKKPESLTLVELDKDMIKILDDRVLKKDLDISYLWNFEIVNQDILKYEPKQKNYKIIANIPYYITSPIIFKFLYESENRPKEMIILMQKEVWDKILDWKKDKNTKKTKTSFLSLFVQKKCTVSQKIFVPKNSFYPAPKVDSTVLFFELHDRYKGLDDEVFLKFIKASFSNPRKKMLSNLSNFWYDRSLFLQKLIDIWFWENTRAEELSLEDYISILS